MNEAQAIAAFGALSQETRLRVVRLLVRAGADGVPAGRIAEALGVSASNISFHLKELERAGIVVARREARSIVYAAGYAALTDLVRFLMEDCCGGRPKSARRSSPTFQSAARPGILVHDDATIERCLPRAAQPPSRQRPQRQGIAGSGGMSHTFTLSRRLAAEALGTALLVATVVGSGIMAERLTKDVALALLGNTLPTGAILVVLITILGPISGAHFNPAVTAAFWLRGEHPKPELLPYIGAQIAGGVLGTIAAHLMFDLAPLGISLKARTGPPQWFAEVVATFGLLLTILAGLRFQRAAIPWLVGLYITAAYWFTASTSFANPAVAVARAFTDTFAGIRPLDLPGFILAQLIGAFLAVKLAGWLLAELKEPADPSLQTEAHP